MCMFILRIKITESQTFVVQCVVYSRDFKAFFLKYDISE